MTEIPVLLIEDDPWVAEVNRQMIESLPPFRVVGVADTLQEARRLTPSLRPKLMVVDVYLPDGSGLEWVHQLRTEGNVLDIIMITAANDLASIQMALRDGVLDYLIKPFEKSRLHDALGRYLSRQNMYAGSSTFTQSRLDRLLRHDPQVHLPKGIEQVTLEQIQNLLGNSAKSLTAEEIGGQLGISRVTAWRYLEYLVEREWAAVEALYKGSGRPQKSYRRQA
ncbi:response regulator [Deinococcus roseus]|uniref:Transcriptional regulatory protein n=1 Tax=Deinococcus roseus TaxID=392414 RepID=A0ABQ2D2J0_9DEIO|nr:response regulator [Deinococcus roseus]GGJ43108.1 response regulator [Deinococcus roseus]